ncbi:MAG: acyltransferase family protein [Muricoprocola sp.]
MKQRVAYYDSIRFLAAILVYTVHFIAQFNANIFSYWHIKPLSFIMGGMSGKLATAVFCVILGYFAGEKGAQNKSTTAKYAAQRYLSFVLAVFVTHMIYLFTGYLGLTSQKVTIAKAISLSFSLENDILGRLWCMRPFLYGSILCFINGKYKTRFTEVILQAVILILIGDVWTALCLLGNLMALILKDTRTQSVLKPINQVILLLLCLAVINRPESNVTFIIDGIASMIFIIIVANNRLLQTVLNNKFLSGIGKNYLGFYMLHPLIYETMGKWILNEWLVLPYKIRFLTSYLLCLIVIVLLSVPFTVFVNRIYGYIIRFIDQSSIKCKQVFSGLRN